MKISPKRYIQGFCIVVLALGIYREFTPSVAGELAVVSDSPAVDSIIVDNEEVVVEIAETANSFQAPKEVKKKAGKATTDFVPNRIWSVPNYDTSFPDQNDVQLASAQKYGVKPVQNREEAEARKGELVYISSNPYYYVQPAKQSIPYLVPRAAVLLQDIGQNFLDSLQIKGIPLHKIIVSSVLRTNEDVANLKRHNVNAIDNSAHRYATTFDIRYTKFQTVSDPDLPARRTVRDDTLKWVLSEVLRDLRLQERCYVKHEKKQSCFHITVR